MVNVFCCLGVSCSAKDREFVSGDDRGTLLPGGRVLNPGQDAAAGKESGSGGLEGVTRSCPQDAGDRCGQDAGDCDSRLPCDVAVSTVRPSCSGCVIDGQCVDANAVNPQNDCQVCDSTRRVDGWSARDGACDDGQYCTVEDSCQQGACAGSVRVCDDDIDCNGVSECDETTDACSSSENQCVSDTFCDATTGDCVTTCAGCLVNGVCFGNGDNQSDNPCMVCDTSRSTVAFSSAAGTACGSGATECSRQDTCNDQGRCVQNHLAAGTRCGDLSVSIACIAPDQCDGAGVCQNRAAQRVEICDAVDNDCDGETDEGFDLSSNPNHCGECGRSCLDSACTSGICSPVVVAANQVSPTAIAVTATDVYWVNQTQVSSGGGLFRAPKNGGGSPVPVDVTSGARAVVVDNNDAFWIPIDVNELRVAALRGARRGALATGGNTMDDLAASGAFVYWVEDFLQGSAFFRVPKAGGAIEPLGTSTIAASSAAAQGNCGYFAGGGLATPHMTRSCAGASQLAYRGAASIQSVAADVTGVYFVEGGVRSLPLDLSGVPRSLAPTAQRGIAVDGEFVYFIDGAEGLGPSCATNWSINRVRKTGESAPISIVLPPQGCPTRIAVDADAIYWTNTGTGQIMKVAK